MARNKKKGALSSNGVKNGSLSPTGISESDLTPPASHLQNGRVHSPETQDPLAAKNGTIKADTAESPKGGSQKTGKNGGKVPPLPAGFLESELTMHKRKLKTSEHVIHMCRQEIANLKGQITAMKQENRELLEGKQALERLKTAQEQTVGVQNSSTRSVQWTVLFASVVALGAAAAVVLNRPTLPQ